MLFIIVGVSIFVVFKLAKRDETAGINKEELKEIVCQTVEGIPTHTAQQRSKAFIALLSFYRNSFAKHGYVDRVQLQNCQLEGMNFPQRMSIGEVNFNRANLRNANFQSAGIGLANFHEANLEGVNFRDANLIYANFDNANLSQANLEGALLTSAVNLSITQIKVSCSSDCISKHIPKFHWAHWSKDTIWPEGFRQKMKAAGLPLEHLE